MDHTNPNIVTSGEVAATDRGNMHKAPTEAASNVISMMMDCFGVLRNLTNCYSRSTPISDLPVESNPPTANLPMNDNEMNDNEAEVDEDGKPDVDKHDRRNFEAIQLIPNKDLEDFVVSLIEKTTESRNRVHVLERQEGSFHHCVFLQTEFDDNMEQEYVLKIPAHGTKDSWQEGDAFMLRNEAVIVQHIRHHTHCPVPEIVAFDESCNNDIEVPYILMKKLPGKQALRLWTGEDREEISDGEIWKNAEKPSDELEDRRVRFLKSLAQAMSQLQTLKFEQYGVPIFNRPEDAGPESYGPWWRWHTRSTMHELVSFSPNKRRGLFFFEGKNHVWDIEGMSGTTCYYLGVRKVLDMITLSPPFAPKPLSAPIRDENGRVKPLPPDTFVLRHGDLDLQNILVDDDGNVTGIIDWDGCMAVPQFVGFATLPMFLRRDWLQDFTLSQAPYSFLALDHYRAIYADAIKHACSNENAKYTKKSALYQAILAILWEGEDVEHLIAKMLSEIDQFRRLDPADLYWRLGSDWPEMEQVLKDEIMKLLSCEGQED